MFRPWRVFVILNAVPSIAAALALFFLPETPKFLFNNAKEEEAVEVLRRIFTLNTGRNVEEYPVRLAQLRAGQGKYRIFSNLIRTRIFFFFPPQRHHMSFCGLRGPPSWAWQECNRLLRLRRPRGAVTLSRWCVSDDRGGCSARRGLKPKLY